MRIRLDIGRRLRRCRDRESGSGIEIGDCLKVPATCNHHRSAEHRTQLLRLSSPKQDCQIVSPRWPQMASLPPPACGFDAAVVKSMKEALLSAMFAIRCDTSRTPCSMDPDAFSSSKAFSTFRGDGHRCMLVLRRRRKSEHCDCAGCGCHLSRGGTAKSAPANTTCPHNAALSAVRAADGFRLQPQRQMQSGLEVERRLTGGKVDRHRIVVVDVEPFAVDFAKGAGEARPEVCDVTALELAPESLQAKSDRDIVTGDDGNVAKLYVHRTPS